MLPDEIGRCPKCGGFQSGWYVCGPCSRRDEHERQEAMNRKMERLFHSVPEKPLLVDFALPRYGSDRW